MTHVLGVRAFGTQLLCEQVIGRALRRQSYDLNEEGLFNVEYADVLGIPFNFNAEPVVAPPQPPRDTVQVKAVKPDRDHLEIRFPRVEGYRVELPEERITAHFTEDSTLRLTPELVGPSRTHNAGIIGEGVDLDLKHLGNMRQPTLLMHLTKHLLSTQYRDPNGELKLHLFGQLKRIAKDWLDQHLVCLGNTFPAQLMYLQLADMACEKITAAINRAHIEAGESYIRALLDPYNPVGTTRYVNFNTSKTTRWDTSGMSVGGPKCHLNWIITDSDWEAEFCRVAEAHPQVLAYVKNHNLGFEVPYLMAGEVRRYRPDFILRVDDGHGPDKPLNLIVEIKGYRGEDAKVKKETMQVYWLPGVNALGTHGRWAFAEFSEVYAMERDLAEKLKAELARIVGQLSEGKSSDLEMLRNRSSALIQQSFGALPIPSDVNQAIWSLLSKTDNHELRISDLRRISQTVGCLEGDVLAVLSALTRQGAGTLSLGLVEQSTNTPVSLKEFIDKLTAWHRKKTLSDEEWDQWASTVSMRWMPSLGKERLVVNRVDSVAGYVEALQRKAPEYLALLTATNDQEFDAALDVLLERAIAGLEANSRNFAELSEVGLTGVLAMGLSVPGLTVTQEANSNGHVDMTIVADHSYPMRRRLGEAKIYDGPQKHFDGLEQLLIRYTTGREGRGLLIAYFLSQNIAGLVSRLRERMDEELPLQQQGATIDHPIRWSFLSRHLHSCGEALAVEHVACNLHPGRNSNNSTQI